MLRNQCLIFYVSVCFNYDIFNLHEYCLFAPQQRARVR
jgi:hypothetical protein